MPHSEVPLAGLLDRDLGRVKTDVEPDRLWGLVPFTEIPSLSAPEVDDKERLAIVLRRKRIGGPVFLPGLIGGELMDQRALYPVIETPQALDLAVSSAPFSPSFWNRVVVLSNDIKYPTMSQLLLQVFTFSSLALLLS